MLILYTVMLKRKYPYQEENLFSAALDMDNVALRRLGVNPRRQLTFSKEDHCEIYNVSRPFTAYYECVVTKTYPQVTICVFEEHKDMFISHDIKHTGIWEPKVLHEYLEILHSHPQIGLLDLGANIGYYTLIAAKMGHPVVAVEPFIHSIYKLHRAVQIESLQSKVTVVHNAVAAERTLASLVQSGDNQGDTKVRMSFTECSGDCPLPVRTVLMDDLLEVTSFESALIKMDIQGFECDALKHSELLFRSIDVMYILMEWGLMTQHYQDKKHISTEKYKIQEMIRTLFERNFRPYQLSADGGQPLNPNQWHSWPFDIVWRKKLNDGEYGEVVRHHFMKWP